MFKGFISNQHSLELGLLVIRVGIGATFAVHGFMKLTAGTEKWFWLGSQLSHVGITFLPTMWGFIAANAEFIGGLCLIFGFATRFAAGLIGVVMAIALLYHYKNNDAWGTYSYALSLLIIMFGILLGGPGSYAFDAYFYHTKKDVSDYPIG